MMNSRESDTRHTSRINVDEEIIEPPLKSSVVTLSLFLSAVVTFIPQLITSLLLIEISQSFGIEVGLAGQVRTIAFITSLVFVGSFLSPTFTILLIAYSLSGIAMGIARPMANAMVGSLFTAEQRPRVISYLTVGGASAYLVGSLSISAIRDWRLAFAVLVFPLALLNVGLVLKGVPQVRRPSVQSNYMSALRSVLGNISAMASLLSNALVFITWGVVLSYGASFFRQHFGLDASVIAYLYVPLSLAYILAGVLTGRIMHRVDRKALTVISAVLHGACFVIFLNVSNLWISLVVWLLSSATSGMRYAAYNGIALEQVPDYRGTMMSLSQVTQDLGSFIGTGIGGAILVFASYDVLSILGAASIIAAVIFHVIVQDVYPVQLGRVEQSDK
jgi:predicted MFS family arabinose efflux permease